MRCWIDRRAYRNGCRNWPGLALGHGNIGVRRPRLRALAQRSKTRVPLFVQGDQKLRGLRAMGFDLVLLLVVMGGLFVLLISGLEVAWSVGIIAALALLIIDQPLNQFGWTSWTTANSFTLTAVPLFVFMGSILGETGVNGVLFSSLEKLMGRLPGGLASVTIIGNAIFGAMCGSSMAATASFGKIAAPVMEQKNYDPRLTLGTIAVGAILSPLIPPSILMVLYGTWQGISIVKLFAAGVVPGLVLATLLIVTVAIMAKLNPNLAPPPVSYSRREKLIATKDMLPFVTVIVIVLGVIFAGVMTPTEASAMGAFLSLVLALAYRRLTMVKLRECLLTTVRITSFGIFIMVMATVLSQALNLAGVTEGVKDYLLDLHLGKYVLVALFLMMYFILGCFFDSWSMLFLTFPFVMPIVIALDFNPIWWGVVYVIAGEQSLVTPPFGLGLYVLRAIAPQHSMGTIVRGSFPLLIPVYATIILLVAFPEIALWFPSVALAR